MSKSAEKNNILSKIVKLEGCPNFRSLGGYSCKNGRYTRSNRLYRADCLSKLTNQDMSDIERMSIMTVIDLRDSTELARAANPLSKRPGFEYHNISLVDGMQSEEFKGLMPESLSKMYKALADEAGGMIARILRIILNAPNGVVVHCTAGKDRTGIISALLLMLAGVQDETIIADYSVTYELMKPVFDELILQTALDGVDIPPHLLMSEAANMEEFIAHINDKYGGAAGYLESIGLNNDEIRDLSGKITEDV